MPEACPINTMVPRASPAHIARGRWTRPRAGAEECDRGVWRILEQEPQVATAECDGDASIIESPASTNSLGMAPRAPSLDVPWWCACRLCRLLLGRLCANTLLLKRFGRPFPETHITYTSQECAGGDSPDWNLARKPGGFRFMTPRSRLPGKPRGYRWSRQGTRIGLVKPDGRPGLTPDRRSDVPKATSER